MSRFLRLLPRLLPPTSPTREIAYTLQYPIRRVLPLPGYRIRLLAQIILAIVIWFCAYPWAKDHLVYYFAIGAVLAFLFFLVRPRRRNPRTPR